MKIDHFGFLSKNIESTRETFKKLLEVSREQKAPIIIDEVRKCKICFIEQDGYRIEIIEPYKDSKIYPLLHKYKNTYYHICCEISSMKEEIERLQSKGFVITQEPEPAVAFEGRRVAFLLHPFLGIVELVENNERT